MDEKITQALQRDRTIDIITTGRKSGKPRRTEVWFYRAGGKFYLSGSPGRRDWHANLLANPQFTLHLKESIKADLPARAVPIIDESARRQIMSEILRDLNMSRDLEAWIKGSPLIEIVFE
jgi:deazaflavin-dependent oxidoreductase (nitroreductase family)